LPLRRLFLLGTLAVAAIAALLAIAAVLGGGFDDGQWRVLATIFATYVAGSCLIAALALRDRETSLVLAYALVAIATVAWLLWVEQIWNENSSDAWWHVLGLLLIWTLALVLVAVARLMSRSEYLARRLYPATAAAALAAALTISVMVLRDDGSGWRLFAVLLILAGLGETAIPIVERYRRAPIGTLPAERVLAAVGGVVVLAANGRGKGRLVEVDGNTFGLRDNEIVVIRRQPELTA
jgi:hypothetical protein